MTNPFIYVNEDGEIFRESLNQRDAHAGIAGCYELDEEQVTRLALKVFGKNKGSGKTKIVTNDGKVIDYPDDHCW